MNTIIYYSNVLNRLLCDKTDGLNQNNVSMEILETSIGNSIKAIRSFKNVQMN